MSEAVADKRVKQFFAAQQPWPDGVFQASQPDGFWIDDGWGWQPVRDGDYIVRNGDRAFVCPVWALESIVAAFSLSPRRVLSLVWPSESERQASIREQVERLREVCDL